MFEVRLGQSEQYRMVVGSPGPGAVFTDEEVSIWGTPISSQPYQTLLCFCRYQYRHLVSITIRIREFFVAVSEGDEGRVVMKLRLQKEASQLLPLVVDSAGHALPAGESTLPCGTAVTDTMAGKCTEHKKSLSKRVIRA